MVTSRDQNMKVDNRSFERVKEFKYMGKIWTNFYSGRN